MGFQETENPPTTFKAGEEVQQGQPTDLELDMLLLFYTLSDQYGRVDVVRARTFLFQQYGILIPDAPITIKDHHVQALIQAGMLPDIKDHLERIKNMKVPKKRKRREKGGLDGRGK